VPNPCSSIPYPPAEYNQFLSNHLREKYRTPREKNIKSHGFWGMPVSAFTLNLYITKPDPMAESKNNIIIQGMSGKFGNELVFRQLPGKTIVAAAPGPTQKPPTEAKQAANNNFQRATLYGKSVKNDPALQQAYNAAAKPRQNGWNVAVADFLNAPDIQSIDISGYNGQPHQEIRIKVCDDFKVTAVKLSIHNPDGSLVEEGYATQTGDNTNWTYITTATNTSLEGDKITVIATDNPANVSTEELVLG
jgi:hypothetical protein